MNLFPLGDNVFYRVIDGPQKTATGIIIPASLEDKQIVREAEVVAHGKGKTTPNGTLIPSALCVGMRVLVNHKNKIALKLGEQNLFTCTEDQILAILQ